MENLQEESYVCAIFLIQNTDITARGDSARQSGRGEGGRDGEASESADFCQHFLFGGIEMS